MELLMKLIRFCLITAFLVIFSLISFSQDYSGLQDVFRQSYSYEMKGKYAEAADIIKTKYDENSYEINIRLGWLSYSAGLFTESMAYYQKAINLKSFAIEPRLGFVLPAAALGNWDMVLEQYREILKIDPMNSLVNYRIGVIAYGREDYETAYKYFEKVVNLYPFDYDSLIMFAWTNLKLGKTREAKVLFQKALIMRPDDVSATDGLKLIQ